MKNINYIISNGSQFRNRTAVQIAKALSSSNHKYEVTHGGLIESVRRRPTFKKGSISDVMRTILRKRKNPMSFDDLHNLVSTMRDSKPKNYNSKRVLAQLVHSDYVKVTMLKNDMPAFSWNSAVSSK